MLSHLCQSTASLLQQGTHVIVPKGLASKNAVCSSSEQSSVVVSQEKITKKKKKSNNPGAEFGVSFFFFCWLTCFKSCENKITTFTGSQIVWLRKMCCFNFFLIYFFFTISSSSWKYSHMHVAPTICPACYDFMPSQGWNTQKKHNNKSFLHFMWAPAVRALWYFYQFASSIWNHECLESKRWLRLIVVPLFLPFCSHIRR